MKSQKINVIPIITFRPLSALSPSFSVISEADMALGRSCLFANTNKMASLSSSSSNYQRYEKSLSNTNSKETYNKYIISANKSCVSVGNIMTSIKHSFH